MERKYVNHLIHRDINEKTGETYKITDISPIWRNKTEALVIEKGYYIAEDGTVYPNKK